MGGYEAGQDADLDLAISLWPQLKAHIEQPEDVQSDVKDGKESLLAIFQGN